MQTVLVTLDADTEARAVLDAMLGAASQVVHLRELSEGGRVAALQSADVVLSRNLAKELQRGEDTLLGNVKLLQFVTAGIDYVPLRHLPAGLPIAANGGAYAEPMAEHAVAMAFAAAKRLIPENDKLRRGEFDQFRPNRMLSGAVCGILGFGGVGIATARRMKALGLAVHAIRRHPVAAAGIDWMGTPEQLGAMLGACDVLVVSVPLSSATQGMIGARELALMKRDAILINLARGEVIDEAALYAHLLATPGFTACIDAWWVEPVRHGRFDMGHPFMALPNVIASPHNSASVHGARRMAVEHAAANILRVLGGETARHLIGPEERMR